MSVNETDYKGFILIVGFIGMHILAGVYDGDLLKIVIGADIVLASNYFGINLSTKKVK